MSVNQMIKSKMVLLHFLEYGGYVVRDYNPPNHTDIMRELVGSIEDLDHSTRVEVIDEANDKIVIKGVKL